MDKSKFDELVRRAKGRLGAHDAWHMQYSGEYDDCPFQEMGDDGLTREERAQLTKGEQAQLRKLVK